MEYETWSNKAHKSIVKVIPMVVLKFSPSTLEFEKNQNQEIKTECGQEEAKWKRKPYLGFFELSWILIKTWLGFQLQ